MVPADNPPLLQKAADATFEYLKTFEEHFNRIDDALSIVDIDIDDSVGVKVDIFCRELRQLARDLEPYKRQLKQEAIDDLAEDLHIKTSELTEIALDVDTVDCWRSSTLTTIEEAGDDLTRLEELATDLRESYQQLEGPIFTMTSLRGLVSALQDLSAASQRLSKGVHQPWQIAVANEQPSTPAVKRQSRRHFAMPDSDTEECFGSSQQASAAAEKVLPLLQKIESETRRLITNYSHKPVSWSSSSTQLMHRYAESGGEKKRLSQWVELQGLYADATVRNEETLRGVMESLSC